jgi:urease subunit gamma/beta
MMNLTPTEIERLTIFTAAELARRHRSLGVKLSHPEAVALIADEMLVAARRDLPYDEIVEMAGQLLTTDDVMPGVAAMIPLVSVEGCFAEGTKMIVVFRPVGPGAAPVAGDVVAGEIITPDGDIEVNAGRATVEVDVLNTGDRDVQVRSHAHFFEVNRELAFDRAKAWGMRLDVPSGTGVRFEPGLVRTVTLVALGGARRVFGEAALANGPLDEEGARVRGLDRARQRAYRGA